MEGAEIRKRFIDYFVKVLEKQKLGHVEVPSSPLVPEHHSTLLFVNSGMVQFTPYFLGEKDPVEDFGSARLCSIQKSLRTGDLDIVGKSKYHLTFFEMMGSWSVGDYGKKRAVELAYDLLTNRDYGYGLDAKRFYPTVFRGDKDAPLDKDTIDAWRSVGIPDANISRLSTKENWWGPGGPTAPGPCGPCTEVLYDRGSKYGKKEKNPGATVNPRYIEIWNAGVFIQYERDDKGKLHQLETLSVDTGAGLERFAVLLQGVDSVFETDLFAPIVKKISDISGKDSEDPKVKEAVTRSADHIRAATFIVSEDVYPSNREQGYVLRKLIRTVFSDFVWTLGIDSEKIVEVVPVVIDHYKNAYPEIDKKDHIVSVLKEEHDKYKKVADNTRRVMKAHPKMSAFDIYQSTGASLELIRSLETEVAWRGSYKDFNKLAGRHRKKSQKGAGKKFRGGLADHSKETIKLHTTTHLLHASLRNVLGEGVQQKGSNITTERLRFDFSHPQKLTDEELKKVENVVNKQIDRDLPVSFETMTYDQAINSGALAFFGGKYGEKVKVYTIGDPSGKWFSREVCGGPHVKRTGEIGRVRIKKQEKLGSNLVRVYTILGDES